MRELNRAIKGGNGMAYELEFEKPLAELEKKDYRPAAQR